MGQILSNPKLRGNPSLIFYAPPSRDAFTSLILYKRQLHESTAAFCTMNKSDSGAEAPSKDRKVLCPA